MKNDTQTTDNLIGMLRGYQQDHIVSHLLSLPQNKLDLFVRNLNGIEFELAFRIFHEFSRRAQGQIQTSHVSLPDIISVPGTPDEISLRDKAYDAGVSLLKNNKVAVLIVAGGQGSRLGHHGPKGTFPATPLQNKTLFQLFAESIRASVRRYNARIPLLIMTSVENHKETVSFFEKNRLFGLEPESVHFFRQSMLPSLTPEGRLILKNDTHLFENPDGHGGSLRALYLSGILGQLIDAGFTELFYCQVDNPLVKIADPAFVGYHHLTGAEMSTKVVRRRNIDEKVGVYVRVNGKDAVVEYSEFGPENMSSLDKNGEILYWAGNTAIHMLSLSFIERINNHGFALPYHCAERPVIQWNPNEKRNKMQAWKFETFVFDAIPLAKKTCCMEVMRNEEFSPIKNKDGHDSPDTARRDQSDLFTGWLDAAGAKIAQGVTIEISPLFALDKEELVKKLRGSRMTVKQDIYLS